MKTLVGIDLGGMYKSALTACLDLKFKSNELVLLHSVEVMPLYTPPMQHMMLETGKWLDHLREEGRAALATAAANAKEKDHTAREVMLDGSPSATLLDMADKEGADLIVIGTGRASSLMGLVIGSVGRALAIGSKQSLLITKSEEPSDPIHHAIFASDGSEYSQECFEKLLKWSPSGLKRIDVLRAVDFSQHEQEIEQLMESMILSKAHDVIIERLTDEVEGLCAQIRAAGYLSDACVVPGYPRQVLAEQMKMKGADLMIVGAQGHGFLRRLMIGSVSLHQVFAEKYPVLLLRKD